MAKVTFKGPQPARGVGGVLFRKGTTLEIKNELVLRMCRLNSDAFEVEGAVALKDMPLIGTADVTLPSIEPALIAAEERKRLPDEVTPTDPPKKKKGKKVWPLKKGE